MNYRKSVITFLTISGLIMSGCNFWGGVGDESTYNPECPKNMGRVELASPMPTEDGYNIRIVTSATDTVWITYDDLLEVSGDPAWKKAFVDKDRSLFDYCEDEIAIHGTQKRLSFWRQ